jgi:hypothetical protein
MNARVNLLYSKLSHAAVSPTDIGRLGSCLLSAIPNRYVSSPSPSYASKASRPLIAGLFMHELIQGLHEVYELGMREGIKRLRANHSFLIDAYEARYKLFLSTQTVPFRRWFELGAILDTAKKILISNLNDATNPYREIDLKDQSGLLFGTLDELLVTEHRIKIVDYKFKLRARALHEESYFDQLHFYALLARSSYPNRDIALELHGLNNAILSVDLDKERLNRVSEKAISFALKLRKIGSTKAHVETLCPGSSEGFRACTRRSVCPSLSSSYTDSLGADFEFVVASVEAIDKSRGVIHLKTLGGTIPAGSYQLPLDELKLDEGIDSSLRIVLDRFVLSDNRIQLTNRTSVSQR